MKGTGSPYSRRQRRPVRLTERGERWRENALLYAKAAAFCLAIYVGYVVLATAFGVTDVQP